MGRKGDLGHYEVGNVDIITHSENVSFAHAGGKSHMNGRNGNLHQRFGKTIQATIHSQFKGTTVATNIATGEQIFLDGMNAMIAAGFGPGNVYACINGKRKSHLGYRFHRVDIHPE